MASAQGTQARRKSRQTLVHTGLSPLETLSPRPLRVAMQLAYGALAVSGALLAPHASAQSAQGTASASAQELAPVLVQATAAASEDLPPAAAGGQVAKGARLGALGNVDVMDTPFNTTSFTAQLIKDQQARTLADVLSNDPSVRYTTSSGHAYENFRIRGFDVNQNDIAINGMFGLVPVGHIPLEFVERVETLKGPSALFSGMPPSGAVGGVVNLVPKRAETTPLTRVGVGYQSDSQFGTTIDLGRRFGDDQALGLRVNGSFSDGDTALEGQSKKREFISAAFDIRQNKLRASLDLISARESYKGGTAAMYWFTSPSIPAAPDPTINQFPAARGTIDSKAVIARAEYDFTPRLSAFAGVGVMNSESSGFINGTHVRSINASGTSTSTTLSAQRGYNDNVASEAGLRGRFSTGPVVHEMVLQASNLDQEAGSANLSSTAFTTHIYNPTFRDMPAIPAAAPKTSDNTLRSVALIDTLAFLEDRVRLTLGLRHQVVQTTNYSAAGAVTGEYDKSAVTPAVAVVFKPWGPDLSFYANYVQGLSKGDSVTTPTYAYNHTFAPYKTEQKEVGVKWNAAGFGNTASLFEIKKPMLITLAGNVPSDDGEKRVRGIEWNTFGEVTRGVRLLGGVGYTNAVQTKTANGQYNGNEAVGAPRWQGNLGAEWDLPWLRGLSLSGKVNTSSGQYINAANTQRIPGWSTFDVGARYASSIAARKVVYRLNIANVMDRHYYNGAFSDTTPIATLGEGRTLMASITLDL